MSTKISTLALTALMMTVGLVAITPPAAASFACMPLVQVDQAHSPSGIWTNHIHPRFTFPISNPYGCDEVTTEVRESWRTSFTTNADDYHPQLGSGEFYIQARVLYETLSWEYTFHCHLWSSDGVCLDVHWHGEWVWREVWTGWVTSPTVKIDVTAPHVEIQGISEPFVQGADADYLTNDTEITLSASDAHSGVNRIEYRIDDGDWQTYTSSAMITGDNGPHTFTYRAIDNVGLQTVKSRDFILDNTTPEQTMIRPNANSVTFDDHAVETCNGAIRVTDGGEALVTAPDHREAVDNVTAEVGNHTPAIPGTPDAVGGGPDACRGQVVETNALGAVTPEELDPVVQEIDAARDLAVLAADEVRDHLPKEVDHTIGQFLDEPPEAPDNVTVDGQDVDHEPVYVVSGTVDLELDVQDEWVGTANASFLLDGELQETQSNGDGVYRFTWDTANVPAGRHDVTLQAIDRLGNQGEWTFPTWVLSSAAPETPDPEVPEVPT